MQVENFQEDQITIDIQEILDYGYCSMYYKLKYNNNIEKNIGDSYDETIRKCFYSYLSLLKNKSSVDVGYLTRLWGKHWIKDKSTIKSMVKPSASIRDTHNSLRIAGIDTLFSFHNLMKQGLQYPILINTKYSTKINNNTTLTGVWEYVREFETDSGKKSIQIIKFHHKKDRFQTLMQMNHDIELTAAVYAFKQTFSSPVYEATYANIYKEKIITSARDDGDFNTFINTVENTVKAINNEIYVVSPDVKCYHCKYRNQCEDFINNKK